MRKSSGGIAYHFIVRRFFSTGHSVLPLRTDRRILCLYIICNAGANVNTPAEALRRVGQSEAEELGDLGNLPFLPNSLSVTRAQFDAVLADPLRHMKYVKDHGPLWHALRAVKRAAVNPIPDTRSRARAAKAEAPSS